MLTLGYNATGGIPPVVAIEDDSQLDYYYNGTYYDYDIEVYNTKEYLYSTAQLMIVCVLMPAVFIIGIIGNTLTVYVFMRGRGMQSVTNLLLVNLAIADIVFLIVVVPPKVYNYVKASVPLTNDWTYLGNIPCKAFTYLSYVSVAVSCTTIIILAVEKYLAIRWYIKFRVYRTKSNVVILCVVVWFICLIYMLPDAYFLSANRYRLKWPDHILNQTDQEMPSTITYCFSEANEFYYVYYVIGQCLFLSMIPLLLCVYLLILRRLVITERSTGKSLTAKASYRAKKQLIRMLVATTTVFLICISPYRIVALMIFYLPRDYNQMSVVKFFLNFCRTLTYINSAANPIIYNVLCEKYRQAFKETLLACLPKSAGYECHNDTNGVTMTTLSTRRASRGKKCDA